MLVLFGLYAANAFSQLPPIIQCQLLNNSQTGGAGAVNSLHCLTFNDYNNVPEITLNVNVHLLPNRFDNNNDAVNSVRNLIRDLNTFYEELAPYDLLGPNGLVVPHVRRAKIKLKLYSEATNANDVLGGIWLYNDDNFIDRIMVVLLISYFIVEMVFVN